MPKKTKVKFKKTDIDMDVIQLMLSQNLKNKSYNPDEVELDNINLDSMSFTEVKNFKAKGLVFGRYPFCVQLKKKDLTDPVPEWLPNSQTPEMVMGTVIKSRPLMEEYTDPVTGETSERQVIVPEERTRLVNKFVEVDGEQRPVWVDNNTGTEYTILTEQQYEDLLSDETKEMSPVKVEESYVENVLQFENYDVQELVPTENMIQKTWEQYLRGIVSEEDKNGDAVGSLEYLDSYFTIDNIETLEGVVTMVLSKKEYRELIETYRPNVEI
jgi:hypothetical protein